MNWATATADEILARLADIDLAAFEEAAGNEQLNEELVRLLLKDPGLAPDLVERISREPRFFQRNSVRVALALHPKLPRVRGLELLRYLYWRDLLRVSARPGVHPQVRVLADQLLAERIPDLTLGEKMALARQASRAVVRALRSDPDPRVIEALLRNVRCTEEDVVLLATSSDTPPQVLAVVARSRKWRARQPVRAQLVKNRRLSLSFALGLLTELSRGELAAVVRQSDLPKLLRESARRLMSEGTRELSGGGGRGVERLS
jgi:hypothetical protein